MEKVILFGMGNRYREHKSALFEEFNVTALMDNDPSKHGRIADGMSILNPNEIKQCVFDKIIVLSAEPAADQMIEQLIQMGIPAGKIVSYKNKKVSMLSNLKYDIVCVEDSGNPYFVVLDSKSDDGLVYDMYRGECHVDTRLTEFFPQKGYFLDIGANIGSFSLFFASKGWRGHAFEASNDNARCLKKSVMLNDFDITVCTKAIYDFSGSLTFMHNGSVGFVMNEYLGGGGVTDEIPYSKIETGINKVDCIALDDILESEFSRVSKIDLIKMDIEGSEVAALRGMKQLLQKYGLPPIYMEVNAWTLFIQDETPYSLLKTACDIGYTAYEIVDGNTLSICPNNIFQTEVNKDVLLFSKVPSHFKVKNKKYPDEEELTAFVLSKLKNYEEWNYWEKYLPFTLKDFPMLYNNPEIYEALKDIKRSNVSGLSKKAIEWLT